MKLQIKKIGESFYKKMILNNRFILIKINTKKEMV